MKRSKRILTLQPGELGVDISGDGCIEAVHKGGQCHKAGVQVGWVIESIDRELWTLDLQKGKSGGRRPYRATFVEVDTLTGTDVAEVTFQPGNVGLVLDWSTGMVDEVIAGDQAERYGVRAGWRLLKIDGQPYSAELLRGKMSILIERAFLRLPCVVTFLKTKEVRFKPGSLGAEMSQSGHVVNVERGGQCEQAGVQIGWALHSIDNMPWSVDLLRSCVQGNRFFQLTFVKGNPDPAKRKQREDDLLYDVLVPGDSNRSLTSLKDTETGGDVVEREVEIVFDAGRLGLAANWETGMVSQVMFLGQAACLGVGSGWQFRFIDGLPYSASLLERRIAGATPYKVTFQARVRSERDKLVTQRALKASGKDNVISTGDVLKVTFQPGTMGIAAHWEAGRVTRVLPFTQAYRLGVKDGWLLKSIDDEPYTRELLELKIAGTEPYEVTFQDDPINPILNGISARQALAFWREYGEPPHGQSWNLPTKVAEPSPGMWFGAINKDTTTNALVEDVLIPETKAKQCPYMWSPFMMRNGGPNRPQVFVSHWWGGAWYDSLRSVIEDATGQGQEELEELISYVDFKELEERFSDGSLNQLDRSYWMCMFALNLHDIGGTRDGDPLRKVGQLEQVINTMDEGMIVSLDNKLITLQRCWCMFEIGLSMRKRQRLRFSLPSGLDEHDLSHPLKLRGLRECGTTLDEDKTSILSKLHTLLVGKCVERFDEMLSKLALPTVRTLALLQSAENGHVVAVEQRLKEGTDPNTSLGYGAPPLVRAAKSNSWHTVDVLIRQKAAVNLASDDGDTPLWAAVSAYNSESAELLLRSKAAADQRRPKDGATPLFLAAQLGHIILVELLLSNKAACKPDRYDSAPGKAEHSALVKALLRTTKLDSEGDAEAPSRTQGINLGRSLDGATPLFIAAQQGHAHVVSTLLAAYAAPEKAATASSLTPLLTAVESGHVKVAHALLRGKASTNQGDSDGCSPLYVAATNGHSELTGCLLDARADIDQASVRHGATPLFVAAEQGHLDVLELLLQGGAEINKALVELQRRGSGWTPLKVAQYHGHETVSETLLLAGARE